MRCGCACRPVSAKAPASASASHRRARPRPSSTSGSASAERPEHMRPHLHLLGILQLVWGAIGLLLGAAMLLLAIGAIAIGVTSADDRMAAGVTAGAFVVFAVALLVV